MAMSISQPLLAALLIGASSAQSIYEFGADSPIVKLTDDNFDKEVTADTRHLWVVEYYADWCGHCKEFAKGYAKAASNLQGLVKFGAVNADNAPVIANSAGVQGFPTVRIYLPVAERNPYTGKSFKPSLEYQGPRTARGLVEFVTDNIPSDAVTTVTDDTFEEFKRSELPKAVLFTGKVSSHPFSMVTHTPIIPCVLFTGKVSAHPRLSPISHPPSPNPHLSHTHTSRHLTIPHVSPRIFVASVTHTAHSSRVCHHILLAITEKSETPTMIKSLSVRLRGRMTFGIGKQSKTTATCATLGVDAFPSLFVFPDETKPPLKYEGELKVEALGQFLEAHAAAEADESPAADSSPSIPMVSSENLASLVTESRDPWILIQQTAEETGAAAELAESVRGQARVGLADEAVLATYAGEEKKTPSVVVSLYTAQPPLLRNSPPCCPTAPFCPICHSFASVPTRAVLVLAGAPIRYRRQGREPRAAIRRRCVRQEGCAREHPRCIRRQASRSLCKRSELGPVHAGFAGRHGDDGDGAALHRQAPSAPHLPIGRNGV